MNGAFDRRIRRHVISPLADFLMQVLGVTVHIDSVGNSHGEQAIGLQANRVGMRQGGILPGPGIDCHQRIVGPEYAQRADPHHGTIGLAVGIRTPPQAGSDGHAAVKWTGVKPPLIGQKCGMGIIGSSLCQQAGEE